MTSNYNQKSNSSGSRRPRTSSQNMGGASSRSQRGGYQYIPGGKPAGHQRFEQSSQRVYESQADPRRMTSVRVGDLQKQRSRQQKKEPSKLRRGLKITFIVIASLLAALAVAFAVLSLTNAFGIEQVKIEGAEHLTQEEVTTLADIPQGATLLNIDAETIKDRLMKDAWIESVSVLRFFPSTLVLSITERTIAAVVEIPTSDTTGTRNWAISSDNIWLMPIPDKNSEAAKTISQKIYDDAENVLHITDVSYGEEPEIGSYCTNENVNCALSIVSGMTTSLKDRIKEVRATDTNSTTLVLDNGVEIAFGSAEDIRDKERVCLELLEQYEGEIAYINVRVVNNPTWRSI